MFNIFDTCHRQLNASSWWTGFHYDVGNAIKLHLLPQPIPTVFSEMEMSASDKIACHPAVDTNLVYPHS